MAGRPYPQFIGPSEPTADRKSSSQRAMNLYVAMIDGGGEDKVAVLESAPGLSVFVTMPGEVRGWCVARGVLYVVAGGALYTLGSDGVYATVGSLVSSSGFVCMCETRDELVIVDGDNGYTFSFVTGVFARITDSDWRGSQWVETMDGYAIYADPGTDQPYVSELDAAGDINALDFTSADSKPDDVITFRVVKGELLLLGSAGMEPWVNTGETDGFPFTRYNSAPIDVGVVGNRAAVKAADSLYWIGRTGRGAAYVYELQGHQPVRISTQAVEESLASSSDITAASMWTYQAEGSEFIGINAPGMASTWVFDAATRKWHERGELVDGEYIASRVDQVIYHNGVYYASSGSVIYTMSRDVSSIGGDWLPRERTFPHLVQPNLEPFSYNGLEVMCATGGPVATTAEAGAFWSFIGSNGSTTYIDTGGYGATLANDSAGSALSSFGGLAVSSDILGSMPASIALGTGDFEVSFDCFMQTSGESLTIGLGGTTFDTVVTFSLGSFDVSNRGVYARLVSDYPDAYSDATVGRLLDAAPAVGEWVAIRFVRTSGTIALYVNGVLSGSRAGMVEDCGTASTNIYIGASYSDASFETPYLRNLSITRSIAAVRDGKITLEISNDGGYTFGPPLIRSLGTIGRRMQRVRWGMLGSSRDRVFRIRVTDAVPVTFYGCVIDT